MEFLSVLHAQIHVQNNEPERVIIRLNRVFAQRNLRRLIPNHRFPQDFLAVHPHDLKLADVFVFDHDYLREPCNYKPKFTEVADLRGAVGVDEDVLRL